MTQHPVPVSPIEQHIRHSTQQQHQIIDRQAIDTTVIEVELIAEHESTNNQSSQNFHSSSSMTCPPSTAFSIDSSSHAEIPHSPLFQVAQPVQNTANEELILPADSASASAHFNSELYSKIASGDILKFHRGAYIHYGLAEITADRQVFVLHLWSRSERIIANNDSTNVLPRNSNSVIFVPNAEQGILSSVKNWSTAAVMNKFSSVGSGSGAEAGPGTASCSLTARHALLLGHSSVGASTSSVSFQPFDDIDSAFVQRTPIAEVHGMSAIGIDRSQSIVVNGHEWLAFDAATIINRAKQQLGQKGYNLLCRNCEHWVNEIKFGIAHSHQVQAAVRKASSMAVTLCSALLFASTATTAAAGVGTVGTVASVLGRFTTGASVSKLASAALEIWLREYVGQRRNNRQQPRAQLEET